MRAISSKKWQLVCKGMAVGVVLLGAACSAPERSRSLSDSNVSAVTIANQVCANCHGPQGVSESPAFPHLAAQLPVYFTEQMKAFRSHGRSDPAAVNSMWGLSANLTDAQIDGLATFYAGLTPAPGKRADAALLKEGQIIFEQGLPGSNTPACSTCHGPKGEGMALFPRLAGQHADYLVKQLKVFQSTEQRPEGAVMKTVAHGLDAANMRNVAAYLEALPLRP
ncbi:cytochrome c553 [Actimicrobium sp. GrIS 1.19]|uniref:c-type cytochrome n=1 Tax=Actimicrobium sp. GrIS 1.19 TaxID=3071708 RepID=UPI002E007B16|nr:cytochrome c553 [Actimicrobium sp. GrIS 1.19]